MSRRVISIVDDDESVRAAMKRLINAVGLNVEAFASAEDFLSSGRSHDSACLILDVRLPGMTGLELQNHLRASDSTLPIIFISGHGDEEARARALEAGAVDFLQKPFNERALFRAINSFVDVPVALEAVEATNGSINAKRSLPEHLGSIRETQLQKSSFDQIVGRSQAMQETLRLARKVAESEVSSVLLQGESGTGKDLLAKAIHDSSNRSPHPFIAINCAALASNLIESELYGHEKGAFTDARSRKEGLLEQAYGGGTIFLDEISEMDVNLQAKLLRVLEDGTFRRVGGVKDVLFNARVIAASNRDLKRESDAGHFRRDLYYRLAVIQIDIPRLSERGDDVVLLAQHFIELSTHNANQHIQGLTAEAARVFRLYDWPGNVRELRNVIERAIILEDTDMISTRYLPRQIVTDTEKNILSQVNVVNSDATVCLPRQGISLDEVETSLLKQALEQTRGNQTRASALLGLTRDQFRYRLKKIRKVASAPRSAGQARP